MDIAPQLTFTIFSPARLSYSLHPDGSYFSRSNLLDHFEISQQQSKILPHPFSPNGSIDMVPTWKKIPFLRWSFWRLMFGMKRLTTEWQVGDGRETRLADYVGARAHRGDAADVIRIIDEDCYNESFLINVGDEKGRILDTAIVRARPERVLELGTYCGYSALRMAVAAPSARIVSIEFNEANAQIARRILEHAAVSERVVVVVGTLGAGGA